MQYSKWRSIDDTFQPVPVDRLLSSGMLRRVTLVRTDVSEEHSTSIIRVTRIGELAPTRAVTSTPRCEEIVVSYS
jgi:hypothetical protein